MTQLDYHDVNSILDLLDLLEEQTINIVPKEMWENVVTVLGNCVPETCRYCEEMYVVYSLRPRCNYISTPDNICYDCNPHKDCPYNRARESLGKYK